MKNIFEQLKRVKSLDTDNHELLTAYLQSINDENGATRIKPFLRPRRLGKSYPPFLFQQVVTRKDWHHQTATPTNAVAETLQNKPDSIPDSPNPPICSIQLNGS